MHEARAKRLSQTALAVGALGVVFGDIGTSPLYAVQSVFGHDAIRRVGVDAASVYGVISLVFWAVVIVVTLKYVVFVMRADNDGEGGIMALIALLLGRVRSRPTRSLTRLVALGILGAALFFGDSMITPAISVLSAVEGLEIVQPSLNNLVVPIAAAILIGLFALQSRGTATVGRLFGPVMLVWFTVIAALGVHGIADHPSILRALSPTYGARFFLDDGLTAFLALGGVVLAVTGAEALYADMGHFGAGPIRRAWLLVAFPALTLNYLGQGALILQRPSGAANPFYLLVPHSVRVPMVVLACVATVIASQAVISGAFSVTRQAIQLGYLPRLRVVYTSERHGQIYVPFVNWTLLAAVLVLVFAFERSQKLASAYGIAVTGTITITLVLFLVLMRMRNGWRTWQMVLAGGLFGTVDVAFLGANSVKIFKGGWLPIATGIGIYTVLSTWHDGRKIVSRNREREEGALTEFVELLRIMQPPVRRVPGTAVFLNRSTRTTPLAMRENVEHNHVLHESVVIVSIEPQTVPYVPESERLTIDDVCHRDDGISLVVARYGFQEQPDIPALVRQAAATGLETPIDLSDITYFLSKIEIVLTDAPGMAPWRKRLFLATAHIAADAVEYFRLPRHRTVLLGSAIEI
ncbi:MAG: potassium transporter Kup [Solirubrobacterales bacterium]|nr:potassium transporter Kup [Solirubrobacterales bacterium]